MGFSRETFERELRTAAFGRAYRVVRETGSTIDLAWEWLRAGGPEGGVVIAERQTQGRGRHGRGWASPSGGLWMSVIARPDIPVTAGGRLGIGMAVAAAQAVTETAGCAAQARWPNDIVIEGRKVGGVLVETEVNARRAGACLLSSQITGAVLSLGLNVNLDLCALPEEVRASATTLRQVTREDHSLEALAASVLARLEQIWPQVAGRGPGISELWRKWDALLGAEVVVEADRGRMRGRAGGVDDSGALLLEVRGEVHRFVAGEIRAVRAPDNAAA